LLDSFGYELEANDELQALIRAPDVELVVCGHSHRRMVRRFESVTIVNAGTLARHREPCFCLVDLDARNVTFFDFDANGKMVARDPLPLIV